MEHDTSTVYVANLPWSTTEDELAALFEEFGPVVGVRVIQDSITGRSRGYGFVELSTSEAAKRAIASLNGREFGARKLVLGPAEPKRGRR